MGQVEQGQKEQFVPLTVRRIFPEPGVNTLAVFREESDGQHLFVEKWLPNNKKEGAIFCLPNGRCVSEEELENGLDEWQFTDATVGAVIDGPFICSDGNHQIELMRVVFLPEHAIGTEVWNGSSWEKGGTLNQAVQARAPWQEELESYGMKENTMTNLRDSSVENPKIPLDLGRTVSHWVRLIALICIMARILIYPLDGLGKNLFEA